MEKRKEIVNRHIQKGMKATKAAQIVGFSRSGYYYKSNGCIPGRRTTSYTLKEDGTMVKNTDMIVSIKEIISPDFIDYGYEKVTAELHKKQYFINRKKVYRLMIEYRLLNSKGRLPMKTYKLMCKFSLEITPVSSDTISTESLAQYDRNIRSFMDNLFNYYPIICHCSN